PGVPSFVFVASPGEADIQIAWALEPPDPTWYVAHCVFAQTVTSKQFGVDRILVTARRRGREPSLDMLYTTVLPEMGHAPRFAGPRPHADDVMYAHLNPETRSALSERDRATLRALYAKPNGHRVTGPTRRD